MHQLYSCSKIIFENCKNINAEKHFLPDAYLLYQDLANQ